MILVDTSIWIDHLHQAEPTLVALLERGAVCTHPMIIGELALGSLRDRSEVLSRLGDLPVITLATHPEVLRLVDVHSLYGIGLSLVDAHLLAGLRISPSDRLWTRDRRLAATAGRLGVAAVMPA
jgi:predicted nucleic acid-binding protein